MRRAYLLKNRVHSLAKFKASVGVGSSCMTLGLTNLLGQLPSEPWNNGAYEWSPARANKTGKPSSQRGRACPLTQERGHAGALADKAAATFQREADVPAVGRAGLPGGWFSNAALRAGRCGYFRGQRLAA